MIRSSLMDRRKRNSLLVVALVLLLLGCAIYLRKKAPPEAARLLPESDGIVYLNLRPLRAATHLDRQPVTPDADYAKFIAATGIQFERDLDEAAFALHRMDDPAGPNGAVGFSTVFVGRFDGKRLAKYLQNASSSTEDYDGHTIYIVPVQGRTDRVALLGYDIVALSNMPTPEQIHSMLDRYKSAALPFSGSTLLSEHYEEIPLLSLAWGIGKLGALPLGGTSQGAPPGESGQLSVMGLSVPVAPGATLIGSVRWAGSLHLRVEEIAPTDEAAAAASDSLNSLIGVFKMAGDATAQSADGQQVRSLLDSMVIQHKRNRAILTATVPSALLQRLTLSTQGAATDQSPAAGAPR